MYLQLLNAIYKVCLKKKKSLTNIFDEKLQNLEEIFLSPCGLGAKGFEQNQRNRTWVDTK